MLILTLSNSVQIEKREDTMNYMLRSHARSVLYPPIVKQTQIVGNLYLENMMALHKFPSDRVSVLELLNSQAALSSENARLYAALEQEKLERQRAEEELRQKQSELVHVTRVTTMGELAASIAHEVNQPLTGVVINGNTCLRWLSRVKKESIELKEAHDTIQRIIRDGTRAGEIIRRIRALFKKAESSKEPLDLKETIREVIVLARGEMNKQHVVLRLELPSDLPRVVGDRIQLQQVLLNLILNAIDAMATVEGRPRELVIQTQSREKGEVMVTVRDTGIGIHPECIEHVFTAFHTTKPGGLGMGLSISRSIVENHSGRLWLTVHEGPGVSFHFTLPIVTRADL
ncbi:MAG: histidine kinase [Planctomycetaceae bacterium]|nr:histidine kinase [Planctomycetaceae bacterium]